MALHTWWLFVVTVFFLCGTPGPNMLHIMSRSIEIGLKRTIAAMLGCALAMLVVLMASAAGLTAILLALPAVFDVLRYVGAAYLIYLGIKAWRAEVAPLDVGEGRIYKTVSAGRVFRTGFTISISNPKLLLFSIAFLPQFIDPNMPKGPQFAILVASFVFVEFCWYFTYALGGHSIARYLTRPRVKHWFNRVTGGMFVGFGLLLLKVKHSAA